MLRSIQFFLIGTTIALTSVALTSGVQAQITQPQIYSSASGRSATLEEQLVNRLKATTVEQRAFIKTLVIKVNAKKLETRLVVAIERYAIRRNRHFPFPFFERAMRYEATKRKVILPKVQVVATTNSRLK